jgi:undecaprenyl-diphosphatase
MSSRSSRLHAGHAVALGLLHGPAELLPVSSSGHVAIVPWLLRWEYVELDADLRKAVEVALHAGTAAAILIALRDELRDARVELVALAAAPPALAGYALARPIKDRLGTPGTVAAGLIAGAVAMAVADQRPEMRGAVEAGVRDALWLGAAQACALIPGVSRNGAALTAARMRGFNRAGATRMSRQVALAPITGATLLEGARMRHRLRAIGAPLAAGATAAFISTLASCRLVAREGSLLPFALYRIALATAVLRRRRARALRATAA